MKKIRKSYEYRMLKNKVNRKLILKAFDYTKGELKKQKEQEERYEQGKKKKKPFDKFNDYWYGVMKIKRNDAFVEVFRIDRLQENLNINYDLSKAYNLKKEFLRITTYIKYKDTKR